MDYETIEIESADGVARVWLNRPEQRNAMNDRMIGELNDALDAIARDDTVRVIVLAGRGKAFCAGGDLAWMKKARTMSADEARRDSAQLAAVLRRLYESPKPTVARVHGAAFAGAMGLVSACDIALAAAGTKFCLSEVKLGLIPSMISPYVIRAIGERNARRYFLSAEVFDAAQAVRIGLVHASVEPDAAGTGDAAGTAGTGDAALAANALAALAALDAELDALVAQLLQGGPNALGEAKRLVRDVAGRAIDDALADETAARIARVRASDEAQEGIASFFEKRPPAWVGERVRSS